MSRSLSVVLGRPAMTHNGPVGGR